MLCHAVLQPRKVLSKTKVIPVIYLDFLLQLYQLHVIYGEVPLDEEGKAGTQADCKIYLKEWVPRVHKKYKKIKRKKQGSVSKADSTRVKP